MRHRPSLETSHIHARCENRGSLTVIALRQRCAPLHGGVGWCKSIEERGTLIPILTSGDSEKVMIILIAGTSHTGKTHLAQKLLEKYKMPYLSIDHLKMGLIRSGNTPLTPQDDDKLTEYLWPIVREIIKTAIENHQNLIVEGCYIPFEWRKDFDANYQKSIKFLCLAMTESYIDCKFDKIKAHASDIELRLDDSDLCIGALKNDNKKNIEGFKKAGEKIILIEDDYDSSLQKAHEYITS